MIALALTVEYVRQVRPLMNAADATAANRAAGDIPGDGAPGVAPEYLQREFR